MLKFGGKLRDFLYKNRISQKELSIEVGAHPTTICNSWIRRNLQPRHYNALKIVEFTGGEITMKDMGYPNG